MQASATPATCRNTDIMFTAAEDLMTVVTVGSGSKVTMIWSIMFILTLVQRRTHVHTVQTVLHSSTLKAHLLKSHNEGTWFTCHYCQKKFSHSGHLKVHLRRHEGVKPYVCSDCPKCFCTAAEMRHHQLKHSDYKQFCCGLCGKDFKHKVSVVPHFRKCCVRLGINMSGVR